MKNNAVVGDVSRPENTSRSTREKADFKNSSNSAIEIKKTRRKGGFWRKK